MLDAPRRLSYLEGSAGGALIWASLHVDRGAWWGLSFLAAGLALGALWSVVSVHRRNPGDPSLA